MGTTPKERWKLALLAHRISASVTEGATGAAAPEASEPLVGR